MGGVARLGESLADRLLVRDFGCVEKWEWELPLGKAVDLGIHYLRHLT